MTLRAIVSASVAILVLLSARETRAQSGISLDVKKLNTKTSSTTTWKSSYSTDKDYEKRITLGISVRSSAQGLRSLDIETYFLGRPVNGGSQFVACTNLIMVVLGGKIAGTNVTVVSDPYTSSEYKSSDFVYQSGSGTKFDGYIVRVVEGGKILSVIGSTKPLEDIGRKPEKLEQILKSSPMMRRPEWSGPGPGVRTYRVVVPPPTSGN